MSWRFILLGLLMCPFSSHAINVGSVTTFVDTKINQVGKEIENNSDQARLVTISVTRISSPEEGGEEIPMDEEGELLFSPSRVMLSAKAKSNINFFYKGPEDGTERYYRITWLDTALSMDENHKDTRQAVATTSAKIGTILVVTPRKSNFDYAFENGSLVNNGNASYRVIAYGTCQKNPEKQCKESYYDLPGKHRNFQRVNLLHEKSNLVLWLGQEFIVVK